MKHTLTSKAAELMRKNGKHRRWRRAFSGMAAVVVFITTYMLILPAITMENQAICGMAEHTHTDACYEMQLVCTQEETPEGADVHVHGPECYEQQQVLTCTKQEGEGHTHTDACYGYVCGQEESAGHTHTDACYTEVTHRELTCTEPESAGHTHGDGCYDADGNLVCTEAESTGHTHGDSCYTETVTRELTCGQEESSGHTHTDACIGLICGQEEYEGHTHTDACYTTEDVLVCTEPTGHTHGDGCYEKVLVCDVPEHTHTEECYPAAEPEEPQEPELICTLPEHSHEDACYDADGNLICGMEEHTHTEECYAPVEIPEEETPTTAFPEEIPEGYVEYTFDNEAGLTVTAYAPEGAFGQDVQLFAEVLSEDSEEYAQAKENLDKAENAPEYTGMAAMDIRFVDAAAEDPAQAEEIEPDAEMGQVFVKIDAQALLPEDVDESTLAVQHHAKVSDGGIFGTGILEHTDVVVETVADISEETGDITATPGETALPETLPALADEPEMAEAATLEEPVAETEETQPVAMNVEAEFAVNSFSTFTITWTQQGNDYNRPVSVYLDGEEASLEELNNAGYGISDVTLNNLGDWQKVDGLLIGDGSSTQLPDQITYKGTKYRYDHATNEGGTYITHVRQYKDGAWLRVDSTRQEDYNDYDSPDPVKYIFSFPKGETLRLYYYSYEDAQPITTADTSDDVTISIFDYTAGGSSDVNGKSYSKDLLFSGSSFDSQGNYRGQTLSADLAPHNVPKDAWNHWTDKDGGVIQGVVRTELNDGGFPVTSKNGQSLEYLFSNSDEAVAYTGLNKLFTYDSDTGYYSYDSALNFATLVQSDGNIGTDFTVYNRPNSGTSEGSSGHPYFIPLNSYDTDQKNHRGEYEANYHFGMRIDISSFLMPKDGLVNGEDMTFEFAGDDDVWVYIDGVLVLDMGGIHDSNSGSINFADGTATVDKVYGTYKGNGVSKNETVNGSETVYIGDLLHTAKRDDANYIQENLEYRDDRHWYLKDYTFHSLSFFYVERGSVDSNCAISFNLPVVPKNSLIVGKELTGDNSGDTASEDVLKFVSNSLSYTFEVLKTDTSGNIQTDNNGKPVSMIEAGTYPMVDANMHEIGTVTVGSDGRFTLKAGQYAQFANVLSANAGNYVIRELLPENSEGIYSGVKYEVGSGTNQTNQDHTVSDFDGYVTGVLSAETGSTQVLFNNEVKIENLSVLKITKDLAPGSEIAEDTEFTIQVQTGSSVNDLAPLPVGTTYYIGGTAYQVTAEGEITLTGGQTAQLGVISGTYFQVQELYNNAYTVTYSGKITGETTEQTLSGSEYIAGQLNGTNLTADVHILNADYDCFTSVDISKTLSGWTKGTYTFDFLVEQVNEDGTELSGTGAGNAVGAQVTIDSESDADETSGTIYFTYKSTKVDAGNYYYKVYEQTNGSDGISYDESYYIVKVTVSDSGTGKTANVTSVTKYSKSGVPETFQWSSGTALPFTNSLTGSLSITKDVKYNGSDTYKSTAVFAFEVKLNVSDYTGTPTVTYTKDGNVLAWGAVKDYTGWPDGTNVLPTTANFSAGKATVYVPAGATIQISGLPAAATATITETEASRAGYAVTWTGTEGSIDGNGVNTSVTTTQISNHPSVTCTNTTGAVLPSTGGMGTTPFLALGTLLTLGAGMLLVQRRRKEGSDAV